jgi:sulfur-carrier protein
MQVKVKLFAYFRDNRFREKLMEYGENTQVIKVLDDLGIDHQEVGVLMINSRHCNFDTILQDDDNLAIFPVVGGG